MMGDDWRTFRAALVAQEQASKNSRNKSPKKKRKNHNSESSSSHQSHHHNEGQFVELGDIISSALSHIFAKDFDYLDWHGSHEHEYGETTKNHPQETIKPTSTNSYDSIDYDGIEMLSSTPQVISERSSSGQEFSLCEDPFASVEEMVAIVPKKTESSSLKDKHHWAHPISHIEPGCVLLANEKLGGAFYQTCVLITEHRENSGTVGIIINRPLQGNLLKIASENKSNVDLSLKLAFNCAQVFHGGPVMQEDYSVLHSFGRVEGSCEVCPGVFVGGSRELMKEVRQNNFDPHDVFFMKGHCAWVGQQLSREVAKGVWHIASVSPDFILSQEECSHNELNKKQRSTKWADIMKCMGGKYKKISKKYGVDSESKQE